MAFTGCLLLAVLLLVPVSAVRLLADVPSSGEGEGGSYSEEIGSWAVKMHNRDDGASQLRFCEVTNARLRSNGPSSQTYNLSIVVSTTRDRLEIYRAVVIVNNYGEPTVLRILPPHQKPERRFQQVLHVMPKPCNTNNLWVVSCQIKKWITCDP